MSESEEAVVRAFMLEETQGGRAGLVPAFLRLCVSITSVRQKYTILMAGLRRHLRPAPKPMRLADAVPASTPVVPLQAGAACSRSRHVAAPCPSWLPCRNSTGAGACALRRQNNEVDIHILQTVIPAQASLHYNLAHEPSYPSSSGWDKVWDKIWAGGVVLLSRGEQNRGRVGGRGGGGEAVAELAPPAKVRNCAFLHTSTICMDICSRHLRESFRLCDRSSWLYIFMLACFQTT